MKTTDDPIVEDVRKVRETHARRFGYDLTRICRDLKRIEHECRHRIVRGTPHYVLTRTDT